MADPLSHIPSGSQYDNLRGMLAILKRDFPDKYVALADSRVQGWVSEIDSGTGRDADQIRDDIAQYVIGADLIASTYGITLDQARLVILGGNEGGLNFSELERVASDPAPTPAPPSAPDAPTSPEPEPEPAPQPAPIDFHARVRALFPWLPPALVNIFADAWDESGDVNLALAETRADPRYDDHFPGIKRDDGSLRMSEQEWFATREAYSRLFREFGLNPTVFEGRFTELMEGEVSPSELAGRLGGAFEQIVTNIPQVREFYTEAFGVELTDQAIFASFLDPDVGDALLNRRISTALVGGEALARGFDIESPFAGRLADAGVDQARARQFFAQAEEQLPTLDELARRFRDPDSTFDVEELAEASVFGSAGQSRRIRRLLAAEQSLFSEQFGGVATSESLAITGLRQR